MPFRGLSRKPDFGWIVTMSHPPENVAVVGSTSTPFSHTRQVSFERIGLSFPFTRPRYFLLSEKSPAPPPFWEPKTSVALRQVLGMA